jgi:hypothetical protein
LRQATSLADADEALAQALTPDIIRGILAAVPDAWLETDRKPGDAPALRDAYVRHLVGRLAPPRPFLEEARRAT